jgi:hypothetical protein
MHVGKTPKGSGIKENEGGDEFNDDELRTL